MKLDTFHGIHMVSLLQYEGLSFPVSYGIKFLTRSHVSHTAALFNRGLTASMDEPEVRDIFRSMGFDDDDIADVIRRNGNLIRIEPGEVIEAWDEGIRKVKSPADQHTPNTPLTIYQYKVPFTDEEYIRFALFAWSQIGKPYDWKDVFRFVSRRPGQFKGVSPIKYKVWFCSCHFYACSEMAGRKLFESTEPWEVFPGLVHKSPFIDPNGKRYLI